jgi:PPOX class probable F420-dependent enzyme
MDLPHQLAALDAERFCLLTTFRRDGRPVPTPVWVASVDDRLVVSTPEGTGKLKRLRHTPEVTLQPCSRRGTPEPGSNVVAARAEVTRVPATRAAAEDALRAKYGFEWRMALFIERVIRRGRSAPRPVILLAAG